MTQPKQLTLAQHLDALPRHVTPDFRQHGDVWYAYWKIQGKPFARRLCAGSERDITRFLARRQHLARYTPAEPTPKYSRAGESEPEPTGCEHPGGFTIWCPVCRARELARQRRRAG